MLEMQGPRPCPKPTAPEFEFQQDCQLLLCPSVAVSTPAVLHQALPRVVSCPGSVFQPHLVYFIPYKTELFLARSLGPEIVLRHTVTNTHRLTAMHTWIQATHTQTTHTHTHSLTHILHAPSALSLAGLFVCLLLVAVTVVPALGGTFGSMSLTICLPGTQHRDWHDTETQQMFVSEEERERTQVQGKGQDIEIRDCRGEKVGLC